MAQRSQLSPGQAPGSRRQSLVSITQGPDDLDRCPLSSIYFGQGFELHEHPAQVTIDMAEAHIWDQSGVSALDQVIRRLRIGGSAVEVVNLNRESTDLFARIGVAAEAGGRGGKRSTKVH